jgi:hypothetical protein
LRDDGLIARYEELRRRALGQCGTQALGLALFMRQGMHAWMTAWSDCKATAASLPSLPSSIPAVASQETCPVQLHTEVAMLLAGMALLARQEVSV